MSWNVPSLVVIEVVSGAAAEGQPHILLKLTG